MDETLVSLDCIHGAVSVVCSMNADYTVTTERLPKPGETVLGGPLRVLPVGKSGNQAVSAARLGTEHTKQSDFGSKTSGRNSLIPRLASGHALADSAQLAS